MPRRLILHIGQHKTGTTTIQNTLFSNRAALNTHGFDYLATLANHSKPMRNICEQRHFVRRQGFSVQEAELQRVDSLRDVLQQISATSLDFIISAELLSTLSRPSIEQLRDDFAPHFDDFLVVGYVRPPRSLTNSWAQQRLKRGLSLEEMLSGGAPAPRYRFMFEKWLDLFGVDSVRLRLFHPSTLKEQNLLIDFADVIGFPLEVVRQLPNSLKNPSLGMKAGNLLSVINDVMSRQGLDRQVRTTYVARIRRFIDTLPGASYRLPHSIEGQILDGCRADIAWMESILDLKLDAYDYPEDPQQNPFRIEECSPELVVAAAVLVNVAARLDESDASG